MLTYNFEERKNCPLYEFLYQKMKEDILQGNLKANERLPSKRSLARHLEISVITVENAYAQLMMEGYIYSKEKSGYYVSELALQLPAEPGKKDVPLQEEETISTEYFLDLKNNSVPTENFPFTVWSRLMRRVLADREIRLLERVPPQGALELRKAISDHLYQFRGMNVEPGRIIVGAGTEYLYGLLIQLLGREEIYGVENPGYRKISQVYRCQGVTCEYIPMDFQGLSVKALRDSKVTVLHISPGHHFPTGIVMPIKRRQELLCWAKERGGRYIIEDDYDSELRFQGRPIQTLQSIDDEEKVIYINTFSKTMTPSIRISYILLPRHLMERYQAKLSFYACTVPSFEQYTLARFIREGYFEQHINRMRNYYRTLRDEMVQAIEDSRLRGRMLIQEQNSGLHFLLQVKTRKSDDEIRLCAQRQGIRLDCLSQYYEGTGREYEHCLVINYSGVDRKRIQEGIRRLERIFQDEE